MKKNNSMTKKLVSASAMLAVSAAMLAASTYAWFTMNKEVTMTGMKMKAQAEKGLLINEVALASDTNWDEEANSTDSAVALKPASTLDLTNWWHANSKKSYSEAGMSGTSVDASETVAISNGIYYSAVGSGTSGILSSGTAASAGANAARTVFYGSGTDLATDGGYYVMYQYYLKSSSTDDLTVANGDLEATVTATRTGTDSGTSGATDLAKSLRVGVKVTDTESPANSYYEIFAPFRDADYSYNVTGAANGTGGSETTAYKGSVAKAINTGDLVISKVTDDGIPVEIYVWLEGEDETCKSDNLTAVLDDYEITVKFVDKALG